MEKKRIMTEKERREHYLPIARIMIEDAGERIEEVKEFGLEEKVAGYLELMEWEAHDHANDMECGEVIDAKYMLSNIYSDKLMAVTYIDPEWNEKPEIGMIWQYNDEMTLIGLPDYYNDIYPGCETYGKVLILRGEDLDPEEWDMHEEDWKLAESLGIFKHLPDNWDMAYRVCLADNEK